MNIGEKVRYTGISRRYLMGLIGKVTGFPKGVGDNMLSVRYGPETGDAQYYYVKRENLALATPALEQLARAAE